MKSANLVSMKARKSLSVCTVDSGRTSTEYKDSESAASVQAICSVREKIKKTCTLGFTAPSVRCGGREDFSFRRFLTPGNKTKKQPKPGNWDTAENLDSGNTAVHDQRGALQRFTDRGNSTTLDSVKNLLCNPRTLKPRRVNLLVLVSTVHSRSTRRSMDFEYCTSLYFIEL